MASFSVEDKAGRTFLKNPNAGFVRYSFLTLSIFNGIRMTSETIQLRANSFDGAQEKIVQRSKKATMPIVHVFKLALTKAKAVIRTRKPTINSNIIIPFV
jgi:hypothetical protein